MTDKVSLKDFQKLDIRIGTVVHAEIPEWSHWVVKLTVDLGSGIGKRIIFAGILGFYELKDLMGKQFPFVVNMELKKIGPKGDFSEGMMLAVETKTTKPIFIEGEKVDEKPTLLVPQEMVRPGDKIR